MQKLLCLFPLLFLPVFAADAPLPAETLPPDTTVVGIDVEPEGIELKDKTEYAQVLVTARLNTGDKVDVTRIADLAFGDKDIAKMDHHVLIRPKADGKTELTIKLAGHERKIPISVSDVGAELEPDYIRDVMPVLSRLGCNQGTCHGAKDGKNGFKLSLRGYDPIMDVRSLTDDHAGRRVNFAAPDQSLMLLKATGAVPHEGQQVTTSTWRPRG